MFGRVAAASALVGGGMLLGGILALAVPSQAGQAPSQPPMPYWMTATCETAHDVNCYYDPAAHGEQGYGYWVREFEHRDCTMYSAGRYAQHADRCHRR